MLLCPLPFVKAASGPTSLAFIASATATDDIPIPAIAQTGDLAVLYNTGRNSSGIPALILGTGWTLATPSTTQDAGSNDSRSVMSYRVLGAGEAGTIVPITQGASTRATMLLFRPNHPITMVTPGSWNSQNTSAAIGPFTIAASGQAVPLVSLAGACFTDSTSNPTITTSVAFDAVVNNSGMSFGYAISNASPVDRNVSIGDGGNANTLAAGYLAVR